MFDEIYSWLSPMFGEDLHDFLLGFICPNEMKPDGSFDGPDHYLMFGWIALGIALFVAITYYYFINSAAFNKWWSWLIMLIVTGVCNFFIGATMTIGYFKSGKIGDCLIYGQNGGINEISYWMFGLANMFVSIAFFFVISMIIKWKSISCKRSPF